MGVLNVERPEFMQDEDIRMFEDSVGKFFDQNAKPESESVTGKQFGQIFRSEYDQRQCFGRNQNIFECV